MKSGSIFHKFPVLAFPVILLFGLFPLSGRATHNLAGQITYVKTGTNTYEITLTTYTDPTQAQVDRCTADFEIYSVAGSTYTLIHTIPGVPRQNGPPSPDPLFPSVVCDPGQRMGVYVFPASCGAQNVKENIYKATYTFSGPGNFLVAYTDQARINNVKNMLNSGNMAFHINTLIRNTPTLGSNNSPYFLNRPVDFACAGQVYTHNPGGTDPEGDSLSYKFITCLKAVNTPVDQYQLPSAFGGVLTQDPQTGLITWNTPQQIGIYNIAFIIEEYRNGIKIGEAIRDMAIYVSACQNDPPVIEAITDTCVKAGDTLVIGIRAWDPNFTPLPGDSLYFSLNNGGNGLNGPFAVNLPPPTATMTFNPPATLPIATRDTVRATLRWATNCDHIRQSFYQVDLFTHDNFSFYCTQGKQMLSTHHVIKIRVTPPRVTGLVLTTGPRQVTLNWDVFSCPNAIGYKVYRSISGATGGLDSVCCEMSPEQAGFTMIFANTDINQTTYTDDLSTMQNLNGNVCYTVVAYFTGDQLSCPSSVECVELSTESFVLTNDSVGITDAANGMIFVSWSTPDTSQINSTFYPPPYTYELERADSVSGSAAFSLLATGPLNFSDTTFFDTGLNTAGMAYRYRVTMKDAIGTIAQCTPASSIYLNLQPLDQAMRLDWSLNVPWINDSIQIFRSGAFGGPFTWIATVAGTASNYTDLGLTNYTDYCYFVRSFGAHAGIPDIKPLLINDSEIRCDQPRDMTPPCIDSISFDTTVNCETLDIGISWWDVDSLCAGDIGSYTVYFTPHPGGAWTQIATLPASASNWTKHDSISIAGCYGISATDSVGNESEKRVFCFENCPAMEPPNLFSPNGDGKNDWFAPVTRRAIEISMVQIFDRWGALVYSNHGNPVDIFRIWNGTDPSGNDAPEGVYYYLIDYSLLTLGGKIPMPTAKGYVVLMR